MIEWLIAASIRYRWVVVACSGLLAVAGWLAWRHAPIDAIPDLSENQVIVYVDWVGREPADLEREVTRPLAESLRGIPGVRVIRTSSDAESAWLHVIFDDSRPIDAARDAVSEKLATVQSRLPEGARPQLAPEAPATGQVFWYTLEGGELDLGRRRELHDALVRPRLAEVAGVAEVASVGGFPVTCHVTLDPQRLLDERVSVVDAVAALEGALKSANAGNAGPAMRGELDSPDSMPPEFLRDVAILAADGRVVPLSRVAEIAWRPGQRHGLLEQDGNETVGGVVMMRYGENPVAVVSAVRRAIDELTPRLPRGVKIVPSYDRTPLVRDAIDTVVNTLFEATLTAVLLVALVMRHWRSSLVIALTLPLVVLAAFCALAALRASGAADIAINIMSLAGIVISIGVLVDASIVMTENVLHRLQERFPDQPVEGDVRPLVREACQGVGRPIFFSVLIMLLSFLPVFALRGLEGKMFHPLAVTKCLVLAASALLAVTLVPALCSWLIRGRIRSERDHWLVRGLIDAYRPVLSWLLDHPAAIAWWMGITLMAGAAPLGRRPEWLAEWFRGGGLASERPLFALAFVGSFLVVGATARSNRSRCAWLATLALAGLALDRWITPLASEFLTPLDERTVMDMPISVPRVTPWQAADDLKARDMTLCRFPEVDMAMGKAGRADTPTDPAPMEMIETMVSFRPEWLWPRRRVAPERFRQLVHDVADELVRREWIEPVTWDGAAWSDFEAALEFRLNAQLREYCYQRYQEYGRTARALSGTNRNLYDSGWRAFGRQLNRELEERAPAVAVRLALEAWGSKARVTDPALRREFAQLAAFRAKASRSSGAASHHGASISGEYEPLPALDTLQAELTQRWRRSLSLQRWRRGELIGFGGELDQALQMPGWANVWTMPIQNRVDMLSTGVNTTIGVRVLGDDLEAIWRTSERIAERLKGVAGAKDIVADPILGKPRWTIVLDESRASEAGVSLEEARLVAQLALQPRRVGEVVAGLGRRSVLVGLPTGSLVDAESLGRVPLARRGSEAASGSEVASGSRVTAVAFGEIAEARFGNGPAALKGENGRLRNYVRLNVAERDVLEFLADAQEAIRADVPLPPGVAVEWTGQFEHQLRVRSTLLIVLPIVLACIAAILYWTYRDAADAILMLLAVPGAAAGGIFFQWLFGFKFSVNVWIGYIACFGMATSTGIIMLVYLRDALAAAGGIGRVTPLELREAVLRGATQRLRPKLLTEGTTLLSLAPMLLATGVGAEVIRPMAAPVLGGILVADEFIDLFLPVMFYAVRLRRLRRQAARETPLEQPEASVESSGASS